MSAEQKLKELKLELPPAPAPMAVYKPLLVVGNMAYVSGHGPVQSDGSLMKGRVGEDLDQQAGYQVARQVGLTILATLQKHLGSLDRVKRVGGGHRHPERPRHECPPPQDPGGDRGHLRDHRLSRSRTLWRTTGIG